MSQPKLLHAYRTLLNHAKDSAFKAEQATWSFLGQAIDKAEKTDHDLANLTHKEFEMVQQDVKADLMQTAEYLADIEQGVNDFLHMDLPVLEQILIDKAMSLADPTDITVLRIRLAAAMDEKNSVSSAPHSHH